MTNFELMRADVKRLQESGKAPPQVMGFDADALNEELAVLLENEGRHLVKVVRQGINAVGEFTAWRHFIDIDTREDVAALNEGVACPPWPEWMCNPGVS